MSTSGRKNEHLDICLSQNVRSTADTGLDRFRLVHQALPNMALAQVDTSAQFLGRKLRAPLLISAMTGGAAAAKVVNKRLAYAAQALGLAMGLGSQRAGIQHAELMETYQVRDVAPDIVLFANLGAVQLNCGFGPDECRRAVDSVQADALVLHLNPLQEALQPEGDTDFSGLLPKIEAVCQALDCPVIVKEVGAGLSASAATALVDAGVAALDTGGAGGTSFSEVERHRNGSGAAEIARAFANWGIPTVVSLQAIRSVCPDLPVIASGGISDGVQAGICLALGADLVGMALALLPAAAQSRQAVIARLQTVIDQLRIAMFCSGAGTLPALDGTRVVPCT